MVPAGDKSNLFHVLRLRTNKAGPGPNLPLVRGMSARADAGICNKEAALSCLLEPILPGNYSSSMECLCLI